MKRREFLTSVVGGTAALAAAATAPGRARAAEPGQGDGQRQYYELRRYQLESDKDRELVKAYWRKLIPLYNDGIAGQSVKPIGVFEPTDDSDEAGRALYVLLPYASLDQMVAIRQALPEASGYEQVAKAYLNTPQKDPAYDRIESKLMIAFAGQPTLRVPALAKQNKDRLLELRTYESHNEAKARLKVEMFNKHEMALFTDLGFPPAVFHGDTIIGDRLPSLTYMLCFESRQQRNQLWDKFFKSDGWEKLSSMERYKNTVSKVHNWFLKPTDFSQI